MKPTKELKTRDGYRWFTYSPKKTGLMLVCLEDLLTGTVVSTPLANPRKRTAAHKAWAGARHSRAPGEPWEIMREMGERGVDPDKKLEEVFKNYGHASVGDIASIQVDFSRVPIHFGYSLFNLSAINSGQEKSSRYQKQFGDFPLHSLHNYLPIKVSKEVERDYQGFGQLAINTYQKNRLKITEQFIKYYKPKNDRERKSLDSRVLDCVRFFLLIGQDTGISFETTARDWARIISWLKASNIKYYKRVGTLILKLLTPTRGEEEYLRFRAEAPGLIQFTKASKATNNSLLALRDFVEKKTGLLNQVEVQVTPPKKVEQRVSYLGKRYSVAEKMIVQYLLTVWPGLNRGGLLKWVSNLDPVVQKRISKIVFGTHSHRHELFDIAATSEMALVFDGFYGETLRDFNRHRAWGRYGCLPLAFGPKISRHTINQILAKGFGLPLYLTKVGRFSTLKREFQKDLENYYDKLLKFIESAGKKYKPLKDYSFIINLLPMAHKCDIWMHGNPKQALYFTHLRTRPGGHINYRALAYKANQLIADSDPLLEGLRLPKSAKPDPKNRKEFLDRS